MGGFIFKINLADVDGVEWNERKEGGMITISCPPEGRIFLRAKIGLEEWLQVLRETISQSKGRRESLRSSMSREGIHSQAFDRSHFANHKLPLYYTHSDCGPELYRLERNSSTDFIRGSTGLLRIPKDNRPSASGSVADNSRFSLLTDIDLHCEGTTPTNSASSSSCSTTTTTSRKYQPLPHPAFLSGIPMGHRRTHSHGRPHQHLPDPLIINTSPKPSSSEVERSQSDAYQFEAHARRCMHSNGSLGASGPTDVCRRASTKPGGITKPS